MIHAVEMKDLEDDMIHTRLTMNEIIVDRHILRTIMIDMIAVLIHGKQRSLNHLLKRYETPYEPYGPPPSHRETNRWRPPPLRRPPPNPPVYHDFYDRFDEMAQDRRYDQRANRNREDENPREDMDRGMHRTRYHQEFTESEQLESTPTQARTKAQQYAAELQQQINEKRQAEERERAMRRGNGMPAGPNVRFSIMNLTRFRRTLELSRLFTHQRPCMCFC